MVRRLNAVGHTALANDLAQAIVTRVTYDSSVGAGYICLESSRPLNSVEASVIGLKHGETILLDDTASLNVDADNFGRIRGVELLGYGDVLKKLQMQLVP